MSTFLNLLRSYVKNAKEPISTKPLLSEESQLFSQGKVSQDSFLSQSSNVQNVDTSTVNSSQRKFNPLTDSHPGLHEYE